MRIPRSCSRHSTQFGAGHTGASLSFSELTETWRSALGRGNTMPGGLEAPSGERPDWSALYLARGDDVPATRPVFTGDVFDSVPVCGSPNVKMRSKRVIVIQHPCAMRLNGVDLADSL
jgi:hypothetical protein